MSHKIPERLWESVEASILKINKEALSLYCKLPWQVPDCNAGRGVKC